MNQSTRLPDKKAATTGMTGAHSVQYANLQNELEQLRKEQARLLLHLQDREQQLAKIRDGWIWKLVWPLRQLDSMLRPDNLKRILQNLIVWVLARPGLANRINTTLMKWPALHRSLRHLMHGNDAARQKTPDKTPARTLADFDHFVAHQLQLAPLSPHVSVPLAAHAARQHEQQFQAILDYTHLGLHAGLMEALYTGASINLLTPVTEAEQPMLDTLAKHVYLALFMRHPFPHETAQMKKQLFTGTTLELLLANMRCSKEHQAMHIHLSS